MAITIPITTALNAIRVKFFLASLSLFSPINFETIAFPPVASITLTPIRRLIIGYTIFIDDNAFGPTYLETNIPSTIEYIAKNTIIITVGNVYLINENTLIFEFNIFFINDLSYLIFSFVFYIIKYPVTG